MAYPFYPGTSIAEILPLHVQPPTLRFPGKCSLQIWDRHLSSQAAQIFFKRRVGIQFLFPEERFGWDIAMLLRGNIGKNASKDMVYPNFSWVNMLQKKTNHPEICDFLGCRF